MRLFVTEDFSNKFGVLSRTEDFQSTGDLGVRLTNQFNIFGGVVGVDGSASVIS